MGRGEFVPEKGVKARPLPLLKQVGIPESVASALIWILNDPESRPAILNAVLPGFGKFHRELQKFNF